MITIAWYLLKVMICSGILCGYYYIALRNKIFHRWNRFYLIASVVLALGVPLIKINIFQKSVAGKGTVIRMLQTINTGDEIIIEYSRHTGLQLSSENIVAAGYLLITIVLLSVFLLALYKISRLRKKFPEVKMPGISFFSTNARGTPFSFLNSIFWNNAIDLHSKQGQQIFNHELSHIKEKHSYDKIFINVVLVFFWINPFFWLIQKELSMIHEFIADKEALEDHDINAFAEMILQTVYPGQHFSITNNFFNSPLKRRLTMFTKNRNQKVSYISRLLALTLAAIIFFAFTIKMKVINSSANYSGKQITVVIDAGHGGDDNGAVSPNGLLEKNINLSIAKEIAALNSNNNIKVLLSRGDDKTISVKERVEFAKEKHADLFISIHVNAADKDHLNENGFCVAIDRNNNEKNKLLASALIEELQKSYITRNTIAARNAGVWVLDENVCPAALIECGYFTNSDDEAFISKDANQEKIAKNILDAINNYAKQILTKGNSVLLIQNKNSALISEKNPNNSADPRLANENNISKEEATLNQHDNAAIGELFIDSIPNPLFTKVENEASFPGGQDAWIKYIVSKIELTSGKFTEKDFGTCVIKFIVNKDGSVSQVEATTMKDSQLAKTATEAISTGPKWIPAKNNDVVVASYRLQPVTLTNPEKK